MLAKSDPKIVSHMVVFHGDESHGTNRKKITNEANPRFSMSRIWIAISPSMNPTFTHLEKLEGPNNSYNSEKNNDFLGIQPKRLPKVRPYQPPIFPLP